MVDALIVQIPTSVTIPEAVVPNIATVGNARVAAFVVAVGNRPIEGRISVAPVRLCQGLTREEDSEAHEDERQPSCELHCSSPLILRRLTAVRLSGTSLITYFIATALDASSLLMDAANCSTGLAPLSLSVI